MNVCVDLHLDASVPVCTAFINLHKMQYVSSPLHKPAGSRKEPGSTLIFNSLRCFHSIKYLGRRSLDLYVLAESLGSHWFLTRQLGHQQNALKPPCVACALRSVPLRQLLTCGHERWVDIEGFAQPYIHNIDISVRPKHSHVWDRQQRWATEHHLLSPVTRKEDRLRASYRRDQLHIVFNPLHLTRL